jgi:WXG100 family type VII secretion target
MSVSILVDLSRMEAAENYFRQTVYALEAELDRLDSSLQTSLSEWTGDARDAYQIAHQRWRSAADEMTKNLAWLHGVIRTAHTNYSSARLTNLGMWRGNG